MFRKWELLHNCIPGKTIEASFDSLLYQIAGVDGLAPNSAEIQAHNQFGKYYDQARLRSSMDTEIPRIMLNIAEKCLIFGPSNVTPLENLISHSLSTAADGLKKVHNSLLPQY